MLFVQHPRLIVELICFMQDFDAKWAKRTFIVRVITISFNLVIVLYIARLVAIFEDDHKTLAILFLIIAGVASISVDAYFTMIYFNYWKCPEVKVDRSGNRKICKQDEEAYENEMGVYNTPSNAVQATDVDEFDNKLGIANADESSSSISTT